MDVKDTERLVQRTKDGDTEAFEKLYQATSRRVYFICLSFLKNEQYASDAMQDTYIPDSIQKYRSAQVAVRLWRMDRANCGQSLQKYSQADSACPRG